MENNKNAELVYMSVKEAAEMCRKTDEEYYNLGLLLAVSDHFIKKYHKTYEELAK